jgi:hypothetical protein
MSLNGDSFKHLRTDASGVDDAASVPIIICVHTYIHTYIYVYIHIHIYIYTSIRYIRYII